VVGMKKVVMLVTALVAISFLLTVVPQNVESQDVGPNSYVKGTVYDAVTEEPLDGAWVRLFTGTGNDWFITEEDGEYEFELTVLLNEEFDIMVGKEGYYDIWESGEVGRDETVTIDFDLEPKTTMVYGYVTNLDTEEPVPNAYVQLYSTNVDGNDWRAYSDENGYYTIFADPGDYKISVQIRGYKIYESEEFELIEGQELEMNISLDPIKTGIYGMVANEDGGAIPDAYIRLYQEDRGGYFGSAFTDDEGNYEIRAPPGEYIIEVSADEHFDYDDTVTLPEENMMEYNVEMSEISVTGVLKYIYEFIMEIVGGIF
jgi:large repetitive protein